MGQSELGEYADDGTDPDRPAGAEAQAVAGAGEDGGTPTATASNALFPGVEETVKLAVVQVDYTVEGSGDDEYPVVHAFGRTGEGDLVHARVLEFRPYFYAPAANVTEGRLAEYPRITGYEETDENGEPYESIRGQRLVKIFGQTPRDVGRIRDEFDHYEADILFPNRFLIDKDVTSGIEVPAREANGADGAGPRTLRVHHEEVEPVEADVEPRVNTFDIEVDDRSGFPEEGEETIICIASHDSYTDEYILWLFDPPDGETPPTELAAYDPIDADSAEAGRTLDVDIRSFETEETMLAAFLDYIEETDPDVATGWNFTDFDAPYVIDRLERLENGTDHDLNPDRLSRVDEVWRSDWQGPNVKGRVMFDLLYAYQRTKFTELESYRLEDVGQRELGIGKERYAGDIGDLWEENPERLLEYNLRDVELCVELDREQGIVAFWNEVRQFVGCKLEDATTPGDTVDMFVLHKLHGEFALPSKGRQEGEEYEGGAVFDPITGVRENVSVLDLKSLYPMCMVTINASPETKVDPDEYDGEMYQAPNGTRFRKEPNGVIREMVDELLAEREQKKSLRDDHDPSEAAYEQYDRQQQAVKVIMNCFTPDTEVLTPDGVRGIRELDVGDDVYSLDPETMDMEIKPVTETHAYPNYDGELVDIETSKIDFNVTPNHRMLVRKNDKNGISEDKWSFVKAGNLYDYCHYEMPHNWDFYHENELGDTIDIQELIQDHTDLRLTVADGGAKLAARNGKPNVARNISSDVFLQLLAWYITEGNVYEAKTGNHRVKFAQSTAKERKEIEKLVDTVVDYYYETDRKVSFSSRIVGDLFRNLCGDGSENKQIPDLVFSASREQKELFLNTLIKGDGDRQPNSWRYSTKSKTLRDDILRLCTHLGLTASYSFDSEIWRIYCTEEAKNSFRMYRSGSTSKAEDGVYCVTVKDNNTLIAGRNGKFQNISNSLYGVLGWDRFRLYDQEMGAAVTATGRKVIEYTDEVVQQQGYEVVYGDSVTGDRPIVVRDPDGRVRIRSIESLFESASDEFEQATVAVDGGAVEGKARRGLEGWEALSVTENGDPEWRSIEGVIRHETDKPVVTLQHKFGESTTTTDHSYVVEGDDGLVEKRPSDVESPLRIPAVPDVKAVETIDVYEVLQGYTRAYEDGRSVGSENAVTKVKRVHTDGEWVWFGHEHHDAYEKTVKVRRHIDVDSPEGESLIRLLAAYVTEGSASTEETTDSRYGASIAETRRDWLEQLQDDYHALFTNTETGIVASDTNDERNVEYETIDGQSSVTYTDRTLKLQMMNELAAVFFREFAGQTSHGKRPPEFVFHLPAEKQRRFLDVLVEGDGSREFPRYSEEYCQRNFDFETTSRELAASLSMLLTQRGKKHSLKYRKEKGSYTVRTCDYYRSGRGPVLNEVDHDGYVYDLSVEENENFVDAVGGIVLHNTDSVMLEVGNVDPADVEADVEVTDEMREKHPEMDNGELRQIAATIQKGFELEEVINESYDEFAMERLNAQFHRFEIEFEKLYRRFFQAGKKKRYAGHIVWKEGKDVDDIDITGFEYQRSDIAPITKEVQLEVIEMIVKGEDVEEIKSYVHDVIEEFQTGEVDPEQIGIPGGIGKRLDNYDTDTAQVRGAKYANLLLGTNFQRGSKPKRVYIDRVHADFFERIEAERGDELANDPVYGEFRKDPDVICFEYADQLPEEFEIDWEKMLDKTLKGPIARILEGLDISWEEVKSGQEQTGLGQFT